VSLKRDEGGKAWLIFNIDEGIEGTVEYREKWGGGRVSKDERRRGGREVRDEVGGGGEERNARNGGTIFYFSC